MDQVRLTTVQVGAAGEYFVAAELARMGYLAALTMHNAQGVDIIASSTDGEHSVSIQVKTNRGDKQRWALHSSAEDLSSPNYVYVFVRLHGAGELPDYHIVPSGEVVSRLKKSHARWMSGFKRDGTARKESSLRYFKDLDDEFLDRWDLLGFGKPSAGGR